MALVQRCKQKTSQFLDSQTLTLLAQTAMLPQSQQISHLTAVLQIDPAEVDREPTSSLDTQAKIRL